jgi:hypothetical protein
MIRSIIESQSEGQDFRDDLMAELNMINQIEKELKILKQARHELAVEEGFAQFKEGKQPELAPTKSMFVELYGQEEFDRVKRLGQAKKTFTWI